MNDAKDEFLPQEKLPDCWKDEIRMNVLFAPLRNRSVNPIDWDSKYEFWKNLIYTYCSYKRIYLFKIADLFKAFNKNGRSPACLEVVIDEMHKNGVLKTLDVFMRSPSTTWKGWAADTFVKAPILWSYNKIISSVSSQPDTEKTYVHIQVIETCSNQLLDEVPDNLLNKVFDVKELLCISSEKQENLKLLLHNLSCKKKVCVRQLVNKNVAKESVILVKFCDYKGDNGISDLDIDVFMLEQSEKTLTASIEKLETEAAALTQTVKSYLVKGQRHTAKTYLRKKREVEKTLDKHSHTLHNIQTLLSKLQNIDSDVRVLDSYKKALSSLKTYMNEGALNEESVTNTMLELDEVMEVHGDIQIVLARGNNVEVEDLEEELKELMAQDEQIADGNKSDDDLVKQFNELDINRLPSPPSASLQSAKTKISL